MINNPTVSTHSLKIVAIFLTLSLTFCQTGRRASSANVFRTYSLAIEQYYEKNYEYALDYINEAIKANNKIAVHFELKGDILIALGEGKEALNEYQAAKYLRLSPGILIKIGIAYYQLNELDLAVKNFKTAYAQKPEQTEILLLLVDCYIQQREYELSLNQLVDYKKQTEKLKNPIHPDYHILLGKVHFEKSMYKESIDAIEDAGSIRSRNEAILYLNALFEVKKYDKAYSLLITTNFINILEDPDIHFFRGYYYYSMENFSVAKTQFELSISLNSKLAKAYILLAKVYEKEGNQNRADELLSLAKPFENQRIINIGL